MLDMASGIGCPEDDAAYRDIDSCSMRVDRALGWQPDLPPVNFREQIAAAPAGVAAT